MLTIKILIICSTLYVQRYIYENLISQTQHVHSHLLLPRKELRLVTQIKYMRLYSLLFVTHRSKFTFGSVEEIINKEVFATYLPGWGQWMIMKVHGLGR